MSNIFGSQVPKSNEEANKRRKKANNKLQELTKGYQSLDFSPNQMNELVDKIKSKIQIININENSKQYSSSNYNVNVDYKNKDIIIICAQNSLSGTSNHFPEQFGKKLINEDFELFSKIDATPMKKRTSGGRSTSNVRTRIYVKNVLLKLENQEGNKNVNSLKKSHPNGNSEFPWGKRIDENYRNFKQKISNGQNNENDKLKIIEFKTYKKYYDKHQGIIKTKLVLKYNKCEYRLYINNINNINNIGNYNSNNKILTSLAEPSTMFYNILNNNLTNPYNFIICADKRINNNKLNIKINNIGKMNKNQRGRNLNAELASINTKGSYVDQSLVPNEDGFYYSLGPNNVSVNVKKSRHNSTTININDLSSINKLQQKKLNYSNKNNFKKALENKLIKNRGKITGLVNQIKTKGKITRSTYQDIINVIQKLYPNLNLSQNKSNQSRRVPPTSHITKQMKNTMGALEERGEALEHMANNSEVLSSKGSEFENFAKKLKKREQKKVEGMQRMMDPRKWFNKKT